MKVPKEKVKTVGFLVKRLETILQILSSTLNSHYISSRLTRLMKYELITSQQLVWQPKPEENPVGIQLVKEGKNLPNSVTEDISGFSLCPSYSAKQQRRIHRISVNESERKNGRNFRNKTRGWNQ